MLPAARLPPPQAAVAASASNLAAALPKASTCQRILAGLATVLFFASLAIAILLVPFESYLAIASIIIGYHADT